MSVITDNPEQVFIEALNRIREFYFSHVRDESLIYVVNLLNKKIKVDEKNPDQPLAYLMKNAVENPKGQGFDEFRLLGDTSLVVGGIFPESVGEDDEYFQFMGRIGYGNLGALLKPFGDSMYENLAFEFPEWLKILRDFRYDIEIESPEKWLRMYEIVLRNSSGYLQSKLGSYNGVIPKKTDYFFKH